MVKHQAAEDLNFINFGGQRVRDAAACLPRFIPVQAERRLLPSFSRLRFCNIENCLRLIAGVHDMTERRRRFL